jgi:hypothetical protein
MKSKILLCLIFLAKFISLELHAQQLERDLLSSSGHLQTSGSIQGSWTVGELVVQRFTASGFNLTQGFQQYSPGNSCMGDLDNNGVINTNDLLLLLSNYGCTENCLADLSGDGIVTTSDLLLFLTVFGTNCD